MKPTRLPVVPLAIPTQLVLGLNGVGIQKRRRRHRKAHPWLPTPVEKVA